MRRILIILLLFVSYTATATNYYVDNNGSDGNNGTSADSAWQTASHAAAATLIAGDSLFFKRGGVWNDKFWFVSSGNSESVIYIGAYGVGADPVITGFTTITSFSDSSNFWSANVDINLNTVFIDGKLRAKGRYPNSGYLNYTTQNGDYLAGGVTGTPDFTGSEIVLRAARWLLDISKVTSQNADTLRYDYVAIHNGVNGYFLQNSIQCLDTANEWCYSDGRLIVYSLSSPAVQVSKIDTLCYLHNISYLTIEGLEFSGANMAAVFMDTCNRVVIKDCIFKNNGRDAVYGKKSKKITVQNNSISNSLNSAINLVEKNFDSLNLNTCDSAYIHNNYIENIATIEGMGSSGEGKYCAIFTIGNGSEISNNTLDSVGYIPIYWNGYNTVVRNNIISNFCFVKDDGAGIYTIISYLPVATTGSRIVSNIIYNGLTALNGATATLSTHGIYLDVGAIYVTVDSNTIYNCAASGIYWHVPKYITSEKYNNIINCTGNQILYSSLENLPLQSGVTNNVFANTINSNPLGYFGDGFSLSYFGTCDSNYYINQYYPNKIYKVSQTNFTLSSWQTSMSLDQHSKGIPEQADTTIDAELLVNPTDSDSLHLISDTYIDAKGNIYNNSIPIPSHYSVIVFKAIRHIYTDRKLYGLKFKKVKEQ